MKGDTIVAALAIITILFLATWLFVGCEAPQRPETKFSVGDVVDVAQTGEKVTVLNVWYVYGEYMYECRVASPTVITRDGLVSADSQVARYGTVWFREFELRGVD